MTAVGRVLLAGESQTTTRMRFLAFSGSSKTMTLFAATQVAWCCQIFRSQEQLLQLVVLLLRLVGLSSQPRQVRLGLINCGGSAVLARLLRFPITSFHEEPAMFCAQPFRMMLVPINRWTCLSQETVLVDPGLQHDGRWLSPQAILYAFGPDHTILCWNARDVDTNCFQDDYCSNHLVPREHHDHEDCERLCQNCPLPLFWAWRFCVMRWDVLLSGVQYCSQSVL